MPLGLGVISMGVLDIIVKAEFSFWRDFLKPIHIEVLVQTIGVLLVVGSIETVPTQVSGYLSRILVLILKSSGYVTYEGDIVLAYLFARVVIIPKEDNIVF